MKKISEMEYGDILEFLQNMTEAEHRVNVQRTCEDSSFLLEDGRLYMTHVKMAWVIALRMMQEVGLSAGTTDAVHIAPIGMDESDEFENLIIDWECCSGWALDVAEVFLCSHGSCKDSAYAAFSSIQMTEDTLSSGDVERFFKDMFPAYDQDQQQAVADFCVDNMECIMDFRCFRNLRFGKAITFVLQRESSCAEYLKRIATSLLDGIRYHMYRRIRDVSDTYISDDDGALVIRMMTAEVCETGEYIDYALIRPFMLLDVALMERFCDLLEKQYPQLRDDPEMPAERRKIA